MATNQAVSGNPTDGGSGAGGTWRIQDATTEEIETRLLTALARVRALTAEDVIAEFRGRGDVEVDSKEAEAVISKLELDCGRDIAKVEDLRPEQLATVSSLTGLIRRRVAPVPAVIVDAQR